MNEVLLAAIFGVFGGLVRALITILKTRQIHKINFAGVMLYLIVVLAVGAFSGIVLSFGKILSFLGGYAGLDLIEGYYKTMKSKKVKLNKK
jgi:hypothetical protein